MGYLIQAKDKATDKPAGQFVLINKPDEPFRMQTVDCDEDSPDATITHTGIVTRPGGLNLGYFRGRGGNLPSWTSTNI